MSNFNGRRAPNVSQFLRELTMPQDSVSSAQEETFDFEDDLALFTNTQFFDYDSGQKTDFQAPPPKPDSVVEGKSAIVEDPSSSTTALGDFSGLEFMPGDFNFGGDFNSSYTTPNGPPTYPDNVANLQPIQPSTQSLYPQLNPGQPQGFGQPVAPRPPGDKAKLDIASPIASSSSGHYEDTARVAAEEDKRRRNTAASARFRVKKKQREQALEKSAKEMTEKVTALEGRIQQLETENKWLKNLIMEKGGSADSMAKLWKNSTDASGVTDKDGQNRLNSKAAGQITK